MELIDLIESQTDSSNERTYTDFISLRLQNLRAGKYVVFYSVRWDFDLNKDRSITLSTYSEYKGVQLNHQKDLKLKKIKIESKLKQTIFNRIQGWFQYASQESSSSDYFECSQ